MKELVLVHPLRVKGVFQTAFREPRNSWERLATGEYLVRPEGSEDEFLLPSTSVAYERRGRSSKSK